MQHTQNYRQTSTTTGIVPSTAAHAVNRTIHHDDFIRCRSPEQQIPFRLVTAQRKSTMRRDVCHIHMRKGATYWRCKAGTKWETEQKKNVILKEIKKKRQQTKTKGRQWENAHGYVIDMSNSLAHSFYNMWWAISTHLFLLFFPCCCSSSLSLYVCIMLSFCVDWYCSAFVFAAAQYVTRHTECSINTCT